MTGVTAVSASEKHTLFLETTSVVRATGNNEFGKLGDGTILNRSTPVEVMTGVQAISAGPNFSLFLKNDGSFFAAGQVNGETTPIPVKIHLTRDLNQAGMQENFGGDAANPQVGGWEADPDGDGIVNLLERAFNLNPRQSTNGVLTLGTGLAGLPLVSLTQRVVPGDTLVMQYVRLKASLNTGLNYAPESASAPQSEWNPFGSSEMVESIDENWQRVTVRQTINPFDVAKFARVRVTAGP